MKTNCLILAIPFVTYILLALSSPIYGQEIDNLFYKQIGKDSDIPKEHYGIVIDEQNKVITSHILGLAIYDGYQWRRETIKDSLTKLNLVYFLEKSIYAPQELIVVSNDALGIVKQKNTQIAFKRIANKPIIDSVIGRFVRKIIQINNKVYFIGRKGWVVYDNNNKQVKLHKSNVEIGNIDNIFLIDNTIVLKERNGEVYQLNKGGWISSSRYAFLKKYSIYGLLKVSNQEILAIDRSGNVFFYDLDNDQKTPHTKLTSYFKNSAAFEIKQIDNKAYIKSYGGVAIYDLKKNKVLFHKNFPKIRIINFALDKQGNFWLSSLDGIFFIETNTGFRTKKNSQNVWKYYYIGEFTFEVKQNLATIVVDKNGSTENAQFKNIGQIFLIKKALGSIYICSSTGLYVFDSKKLKIEKVLEGKYESIATDDQSNWIYALGENELVILAKNHSILKTQRIIGTPINSIWFSKNIYYSTDNKVYRVDFNANADSVLSVSPIIFPSKTYSDFDFFKQKNSLYITNSFAIFKVSETSNNSIKTFTKKVKGLKQDSKGKYQVSFLNAHPIDKDKIFVIPMYGGEYKGENMPGYLTSNNSQGIVWNNKPFRRLGKYQMDNSVRTNNNTFELITNEHIIEYDPKLDIDVDYKFKSYIREVLIKTEIIDTTQKFEEQKALGDSAIYLGNSDAKSTKLHYQNNTLTFIYASDSWAAYERNEYSYRLIGQNETWSKWSKEQKKEYTNLREGTYTFQVRCKNVYGTISSVDSYTFIILPPWYRTWWAYMFYILGAIGLLVGGSIGYSRFRNRQIRRRNQELEQVVEERTEEIRAQKEEITQQAEELKTTNEKLKTTNESLERTNDTLETTNEALMNANTQIQKEKDEKVKLYLQEAAEATNKLQEIRQTLANQGAEMVDKMLNKEIKAASEFVIIRDKVRKEFPDFAQKIDQARTDDDKKITPLMWQVAHCLMLGLTPIEVAEILPTTNRSVSSQGSILRRMGLLPPSKKSTKPKKES